MHTPVLRRIRSLILPALLAAGMLPSVSVQAAEEKTPEWLSAVGDFFREGLAPPRTAEDVMREERERRAAETRKEPKPEPAVIAEPVKAAPPAPEVQAVDPVPVAVPAIPDVPPAPTRLAVNTMPAVKAPPPPAAPVASPAALPVPEPRPRSVVPVRAAPAEPLPWPTAPAFTGSRIAATATLDQAIKLGGNNLFYGERVKKPAK